MLRIVRSGPADRGSRHAAIEAGRPKAPSRLCPPRREERHERATFDLVPIWTAILGFGVFFYVLLDGFDLGVGILYGFAPDRAARNLVMNSIAPVWDGNETWLVLGGVGLLAAFPLAFAIIIPAVYFPILMMLLALVFRGRGLRIPLPRRRAPDLWDHGFAIGSALAASRRASCLAPSFRALRSKGGNSSAARSISSRRSRSSPASPCCSATLCSARAGWC